MKVTFQKEQDDFYATLRSRVDDYFSSQNISKYANGYFYLKGILLTISYVLMYLSILTIDSTAVVIFSYILMGPLAIMIGINVAHDAAHDTISKKKWINNLFVHLFDFLGANSYIWKKRHVFSHHSYPNILNEDADLKQNKLVRIFPNDDLLPAHKYQFIYAPMLYLLYTINWLFFRDFKDFTESKIGSLRLTRHKSREILKLLFFKLFYVAYILVIPLLFSKANWSTIVLGILLMNFAASIFITLALIPSHVAEDSLFLLPDENGVMPNSWSHHQVLSVTDFATSSWFLNYFFGGFNHHITHHLFPNVNHIHYTAITPIVKETIQEFGLPYNYEDSFINAYLSHFKLLRNNGKKNISAHA